MPVQDWSATADENTSIDGINIAEHCPAKNINNAIRSVMAALKTKCDALDGTDNTLRRGAVIGEVRWFAMSQPPTGWLVCNGATVNTSDYAALFAAIGKTFTPQLTSTHPDVENPEYSDPAVFRLPNLIGKVPWGATSVGTVLDAGLPNIKSSNSPYVYQYTPDGISPTPLNSGCLTWRNNGGGVAKGQYSGTGSGNFYIDASKSSPIYGKSSTVQPPALCLLPCIRYE